MKVVICDRFKEAKQSQQLIHTIAQKHAIRIDSQILTSGQQLLFYVDSQNTDVDLIYLENQLEDISGLDVAKRLRRKNIPSDIVFFTKDSNHVRNGYDVDALNYLIKQTTKEEEFERVLLKAISRARHRKEEYLDLSFGGENRKVKISSIHYFEISRRIVTVHYDDGESFRFYSTLSRLEETLTGKGFVRIHQAFLVAENYICQRNKQSVVLCDKTLLPIGRSYQSKL